MHLHGQEWMNSVEVRAKRAKDRGAYANFGVIQTDVHEADADSAYSTTVLRI